jgi:hypothetical protein
MCPKRPSAKSLKDKRLTKKNNTKWPHPFMFQYPRFPPPTRLHFMHAAPIALKNVKSG